MGRIQEMLNKQNELQKRYGYFIKDMEEEKRTEYIKENMIHVIGELDEIFRELPYGKHWKCYKNFDRKLHKENAKMEFIDCWHFMMNIALALDIDEEEFIKLYNEKNKINHKRIEENYGEMEK